MAANTRLTPGAAGRAGARSPTSPAPSRRRTRPFAARTAAARATAPLGPALSTRICAAWRSSYSATTSTRAEVARIAADLATAHAPRARPRDRRTRAAAEHRLLAIFADLRALSPPGSRAMPCRRQTAAQPAASTCTHSCARSTRRPRACPPASSNKLGRALAHYGIDEPGAHAGARGRLATARSSPSNAPRRHRVAILATLDRRLEQVDAPRGRRRRFPRSARRFGRLGRRPAIRCSPTSPGRFASDTSTSG